MEEKRKIFIINLVSIILLVMCLAVSGVLIIVPKSKTHISIIGESADKLKNNYTTTEESSNTWNISATEKDNVIATLSDDGTLTISGTGNMKDFYDDPAPWTDMDLIIINNVKIEDGVTSIGDYVFEYGYINNVEIGSGVTKIGEYSFYCSRLENINVSENNTTYTDIDGILYTKDKKEIIKYPANKQGGKFVIPNSVTKIGHAAFDTCINLIEIEIPSSVTTIESFAFYGTVLNGIKIPNSVTEIEDYAFDGCSILNLINKDNKTVELPDIIKRSQNETDILYSSEEFILENCTLEDGNVKIEENVENATIEIQNGKLEGLTYMIAYNTWDVSENGDGSVIATLDKNGVLTISGKGNMYDYDSLWGDLRRFIKNVKIEDGVTSIDGFMFAGCTYLTNIEIGSGVTQIGEGVFEYCLNLKNINVNENNKNYTDENGILYTKDKTKIVAYPAGKNETEFKIPCNVTDIGIGAFRTCFKLKNVEISSSVTRIEYYAFGECVGLKTIKFPKSVTDIGAGAFCACFKLENVEIPSSVTRIEVGAFWDCIGLKTIKLPKSVTEIEENVFYGCDELTILCYSNSYAETYAKENQILYKTIYLSSEEQNIDEINLLITKILPKTTIQKLKISLLSDLTYEITDKEGNVIEETLANVKTGHKLKLENGDTYILIVTGDCTGDGKSDIQDIFAINKHRLNNGKLINEYLLAGDANRDGKTNINDIFQINKYRLGIIETL